MEKLGTTVSLTSGYHPQANGQAERMDIKDIKNKPGNSKHNAKYIGPHKILHQINPVTYNLQLPRHLQIHPTFHVSLLKCFVPGPLDEQEHHNKIPETIMIDNQPVYTIRKILRLRRRAKNIKYLISWEGYGPG